MMCFRRSESIITESLSYDTIVIVGNVSGLVYATEVETI